MQHRPRRTILVCLLAVLLHAGCRPSSPELAKDAETINDGAERDGAVGNVQIDRQPSADSDNESVGRVTFVIHQGADDVTFSLDGVPQGATLETVMRQIDQTPISIRGSGPTAFVDQIGESRTSGSEGWTYTVDGEFATRGIGETQLHPPTTVEWKFGSMDGP